MKFEFTRSLPGIKWVVSEIFQAICIENLTSIHHNLTDADKSRPNGYFSELFSMRHSFELFAEADYVEDSKFDIHSHVWLFLE